MDSLDLHIDDFEKLLLKGVELVKDRYATMYESDAYPGYSPTEVKSWFDELAPQDGMDLDDLLALVKNRILDTATLNIAPKMFAYVMSGGNQVSILAEMLESAINQNVGKWHLAPVMSELERRVVQWGAEVIGYGSDSGGGLVSGGSAANLKCLTVARNIFLSKYDIRSVGLYGLSKHIIYGSMETHGCVDKSIELLGLGTDNYRKIPILSDYTIDVEALERQIAEDIQNDYIPFCLIGNAGTVNTGAIDPLKHLASIAKKHGMWYHVDGAYGALAAAVPSMNSLFAGIDLADSVAIDYHKWLYQPFEVGCALVKNWDILHQSYYKKASYLSSDIASDGRLDLNEYSFQLSRNAKALKVWMSWKAYGTTRIAVMIQKDIQLIHYLAAKIIDNPNFELCLQPILAIACFRYIREGCSDDEINILNQKIIPALETDGRVFITGTILENRPVIRACLINHRLQKNHIDHLVDVIEDVGSTLEI